MPLDQMLWLSAKMNMEIRGSQISVKYVHNASLGQDINILTRQLRISVWNLLFSPCLLELEHT